MTERKTIKINPEIFNMGGKTKKVREKKELPSMKPLITPNTLKNKLLKRIKEHKNNETTTISVKTEQEKYSDEFFDSMNYLSTLSKQKKINEEKENYEKKIQRKREELQRRTVKNHGPSSGLGSSYSPSIPMVQLELPDELKEPKPFQSLNPPTPTHQPSMNLKYKIDNDVPYGVLKGGYNPTYKTLNKTVRNYDITGPTQALTINTNSNTNLSNINRENRLNELKEKIKEKQSLINYRNEAKAIIENNIEMNKIATPILNSLERQNNSIQQPMVLDLKINTDNNDTYSGSNVNINNIPIIQNQLNGGTNSNNNNWNNSSNNSNTFNPSKSIGTQSVKIEEEPIERFKKEIVKKTIRRKYKLGKSKSANKVSILIKDRNTRRNILNAQKELKKKPLNDVKNYLHNHGLIKIGSNAPNDILRKMYEYSMLSGEINNNSADVLLHNYLKENE